jgi:type I restriction enzyme S subunit
MKQGLLHDLLTRGIDENGELRDPVRHPEQFKDSPLGRIPKEWEVATISALLSDVDPAMRSGPFGSALLKHELVSSGVPLLGIDNVHVDEFVAEYRRFVTAAKARTLARYLVRPRDVMITIMGTVGRCAVVPEDICQALSTKHVWTITFDQTRYSPYLACLQLNYAPWVLRHLSSDEQGGIMSAIRSETLRTTRLPVPNRDEQRAVERVLDENDRKISAEREALSKLRLLKQGLMDDLLTGRVRVKVTEPAE